MTLLVTGGAGFVGSNFVLGWLARHDEPVVTLDALTYAGNRDNLAALDGDARHGFVHGDVLDAGLLARLLGAHRPRAVLHFAAESHVDRSIHGPAAFVRTNVDGTQVLLEAARAHWQTLPGAERDTFRFVQVSTDEVYGSLGADEPPFTEARPVAPANPYSASKAGADHLAMAWHHTYGLPTIVTRCGNNHGPFQFPEKLVPLVILNALAGRPLPLYGDGLQRRDWIHVDDHCAALRAVLAGGVPGRCYHVGAGAERSNLELVQAICALLDELRPDPAGPYARLITHMADRPGHDRRYAVDATRLRSELGWAPAEDFAGGLRRTVQWVLAHPAWIARVQTGAYLDWVAMHYARH